MSLAEDYSGYAVPSLREGIRPSKPALTTAFNPVFIPRPTYVDPQAIVDQYHGMLNQSGVRIVSAVRANPDYWEPQLPMPGLDPKPGTVSRPLAVFNSFVFPPLKTGEVGYDPYISVFEYEGIERTAMAIKISEAHEAVHFSQFNGYGSAALHAIHLNGRSKFVVGVREWVKLTLLTEAEAYAKATLMAWALKHALNDIVYDGETKSDPVTVKELEARLELGQNLHDALVDLAVEGMNKLHHEVPDRRRKPDPPKEVLFKQFYANQAVDEYVGSIRLNWDYVWQEFPYEIIRLEDSDYEVIGADFGPQIMPALYARMDEMFGEMPEIEEKIADYEAKLAIYYPNQLRTLGQALQGDGMTFQDLISCSSRPYQRDVTSCPYYPHFQPPKPQPSLPRDLRQLVLL